MLIILLFTQCNKKEDPKPEPKAIFSVQETGETFLSISFSNSSTNASSYLWDFGDGGTSTDHSPIYTYKKAGVFTIKLTAIEEGKSSTTTQSITISAINVKSDFLISGNYGNAPIKISFSNFSQNGESYQWDFGDGGNSTEKEPTYSYLKGGKFTIKLTVTAKDGTTVSSSQSITITDPPALAVANFSFTGENNYAPFKIIFSNSSENAISYVWDFGDGTDPSSEINPKHLYVKGGTYNVVLYALNAEGKKAIISKNIVVKNAPTKLRVTKINILKLPFTDDKGNNWDVGDGPDIYFAITSTDQKTNLFKTSTANNLSSNNIPGSMGTAYGFPYTFTDVNYKYGLVLYDEDTNTDDWIGGYFLTIKNYMPIDGSSYPTTIPVGTTLSAIQFDLEVEWLP